MPEHYFAFFIERYLDGGLHFPVMASWCHCVAQFQVQNSCFKNVAYMCICVEIRKK